MNIIQPGLENALQGSSASMRSLGESQALYLNQTSAQSGLPGLPNDGLGLSKWLRPGAAVSDPSAGLFGAGSALGFGSSSGSSNGPGGFLGIIAGLIKQLGAMINQTAGEATAEGPGTQTVSNGTFASTGDPHLSENATVLNSAGNASPANQKFDSMNSHDNLLSSQDFDGGYRLSTAVTAPNAKGVTMNASATVHMNADNDNITMRNDGTFSISSDGNNVQVGAGQAVTLGGGERVTSNADGSLTVAAQNAYGGTISTTLAAKGGGVDATATVHAATVGGDIAAGQTANGTPGTAPYVPTSAATTFA